MEPVSKEQLTPAADTTLIIYGGENYKDLPARHFRDGKVFHEWELTPEEVNALTEALMLGKKPVVRVWQHTFNQKLQPVSVDLFVVE